MFVSFVTLSLWATCGEGVPDVAVESMSGALVVTYEAEALTRTASCAGSQVTSEAGASGGQYVQLSGTPATNAWIQFTLPNVAAGTYDVKLLYKAQLQPRNRPGEHRRREPGLALRPVRRDRHCNRWRATWRARR